MDARLAEAIDRYYRESGIDDVQRARSRTEKAASELVSLLRSKLPVVRDPFVADYGKCVEIRGYRDVLAPKYAGGSESVRAYIVATGMPWAELAVLMSWVGPYAIVGQSALVLGPGGTLEARPFVGDEVMGEGERACRQTLRALGFEILSEADLAEPVDIPAERILKMDGTLPVTTVGGVLFYPWWGQDVTHGVSRAQSGAG